MMKIVKIILVFLENRFSKYIYEFEILIIDYDNENILIIKY